MHERAMLRMRAKLLEVQCAKRDAAQAALAAARTGEQSARREQDEALKRCRSAQEQWFAYIADPGFSPEYCRFLSASLLDREAESEKAALRTQAAVELHAARRREWQMLEAQLCSGKASFRRLKRKAERRLEEKRLAARADRTTYDWCRT